MEDFGKGTLAGGTAEVTLDPDFAALVDTKTLHVFLTPHVAEHLHVPAQTATGFTVVAIPSAATGLGGVKRPAGVGTFSYRVVAKRKDMTSERLAKVAAPTAPNRPSAFVLPAALKPKPPTKKP